MKVLLDYQTAVGGLNTGVGVYTEDLGLALKARVGEGLALARRAGDAPIRTIPERLQWEQWGLLAEVRRRRPDLLHSPGFTAPFLYRGPLVVTAHDIAIVKNPQWMRSALSRIYWRDLTVATYRRASRIIAVSRYTKDNLVEHLSLPAEKITVVHSGTPADCRRAAGAAERVEKQWGVRDFILFVGTFEPRKNLSGVLDAYLFYTQGGGHAPLVLAGGGTGEYADRLRQAIQPHVEAGRMKATGFLSRPDLIDLYSAAMVLFFPSLEEGFGFPALEAMVCGCPVIVSRQGPFLELLEDAAMFVSPQDAGEMGRALQRMESNDAQRQDFVRRGLACAAQYTWDKTAEKTAAVYREVVGA
ncbi:MAG: glycosyltransferase family 4 protein [bacterium]